VNAQPAGPDGRDKGVVADRRAGREPTAERHPPLKHFDDYISGFRPARDEPSVQMEVAHQEVQPLNMLSGQERERWRVLLRALVTAVSGRS
jgi:hypothetical protein